MRLDQYIDTANQLDNIIQSLKINGYTVPLDIIQALENIDEQIYIKGGEGSGNFGHAGRPGEVGGSASDNIGGISHEKGKSYTTINKNASAIESLPNYSVVLVAIKGKNKGKVFASDFSKEGGTNSHEQIAEELGDSIDNYVRYSMADKRLVVDVFSAGVDNETSPDFDTRAMDNIYKANDYLSNQGISSNFPVVIKPKNRDKGNFNTTIKALSPRPWSLFETLLITTVQEALQDQLDRLISLFLADRDLSENDFQSMSNILLDSIQSIIINLAKAAAEDAIGILPTAGISTSWGMINLAARDYALTHAATRITRVNETTKEAVRELIAQWKIDGTGIDDLRSRLEALTDDTGTQLFGEVRARRIATTEVTNIYAGSYSLALEKNGYIPPAVIPSLHVNCRCSIRGHITADGVKVMVWYTARDEMVCTRPIETNIGIVNGCRELHKMIISEGYTRSYI